MTAGYRIRDPFAPHFITTTVVDWIDVFTRKQYRDYIIESLEYSIGNKELVVFAYVMPIPEEGFGKGGRRVLKYTKHYYIGSERIASFLGTRQDVGLYCDSETMLIPPMDAKVLEAGDALGDVFTHFDKTFDLDTPHLYGSGTSVICGPTQITQGFGAYWYHPDHLGSSSYITNLQGKISQHMEYLPFGEILVEEHLNSNNSPYKFNAKEYDSETGNYYYGARYYSPKYNLMLSVDPAYEMYPGVSPFAYVLNNPIRFIDPDGRMAIDVMPPSTDVRQNNDGSYTVVGAYDDGDNNIYVVGADGKRTGATIGTTMQPTDFMGTNDKTGEFSGHANVTFNLNNLTVSGSVKPNEHTTSSIYGADAQRLLDWGQELFRNEVTRQSPATFYGELEILAYMSGNYDPANASSGQGALDLKSSLGLGKYTAISAGNTSDGKPIITTLRAVNNIVFGANMRSTKPYLLGTPNWYYGKVMPKVGAYNQSQNNGNGYNSGYPYFGEHTYSGSYIYYGYFGQFYKK